MPYLLAKWLKLIPYLWRKRLKNLTLWGRTYLYSRTASCVSFVRKSAWKNEKNIGYDPQVTSSAGAGRALKIGSSFSDFFFFFTLYFIFTHFLYKTEGPDGVQMGGGRGGGGELRFALAQGQ